MDTQISGMITLLSNALTERSCPLPADFDWEALNNNLSAYKNLRGLLIRGATLAGIPRSHPVIREWMMGFLEDIRRSRNQMQQLQVVYDAFDAQGIDYMPVKGALLKTLYPQPEMRMMEDADILIREQQLPQILPIMLSMGMEERRGDTNESVWNHPKLLLELHKALVSSRFGKVAEYLQNSWDFAIPTQNPHAYRLREENHFIFLVIHFAKHYMRSNISPKDICDLWVFRNAYPDMDEQYIQTQLQQLELGEFYQNILAVLDMWFRGAAPTPVTTHITDTVFQRGISDETSTQWYHTILSNQNETQSAGNAKFRFVLHKIFPPVRLMQARYPILIKKVWLLPVYWIVRWFEVIFLQKRLDHVVTVLTKDDGLQNYTEHLELVGLRNTTRK